MSRGDVYIDNSLQRYRTTDNSRGFWDSKLNVNKKGSQVFSWDDEFWKQSSRRGPQSVASSFEEVESLCLSKSSSDSMGSSQRPWDRLGHGQDPGMWGSKRRFMSRQSSTTSTSTSRSSGLVGDHVISEAHGEQVHQNASIKDTLLESMELLGAHGNLDLAEKIYLEKIFHRVLDWNNGMPVSSSNSSKAMDKHFWNSIQNQAANNIRDRQLETDSPRLQASLKERLERLNQSEQSPTKSKMVLQLPNPAETKRRRDLIVPDEEDLSSSSYKQLKASAKPETTTNPPLSSKEANLSSKDFSGGDTASRYSYLSSLSSISMDNSSQRGSQIGSNASQRMQSPSLATFLPPTFRLSGSFESTASPPDTYMFNQPYTPSHAERVLMGLGFGATEGFLPERFLRDWYSKIAKAQMEAQIAAQAEVKTPDISESSPTFPPNTPVTVEHEMQKAERRDSHVSTASSMLDEAANFFPSNMSQDSKIQRLKEYIAAYSNHANSPTEGRDFKIRHFATTRQKSLPLFLETLSEEEEGRSRISGVDPFDKEARLQMFISDAMSSSGKSTGSNSENSYISSNQSESDSVSSCSDNRSSLQRKNQHIKAYKKHLDEEHKMENERKEKELKARKLTEDDDNEHEERHRHRRPKGSPVRQSTVRRNENFGKAPNTPGSDCPVTPGHQLQLQDAEMSKTTTESQPTDNKFNTGAKQDSMHSKDSIEVEEIIQFQLCKTKFGRTKEDKTESISTNQAVEPAMVSIVLEDVDRDTNHCDNTLPISYLGLPASRCSSSSLSPIPQSPVTVIEVGLDNQQDSLDTEGTGSSKETDDDNCLLQTSSSDDTGARKHGRCKSRSSKSLNTPGHDDFPRRRNSTASPLPSFQSRLSPSGDYGEMKPRRRLSLEVPVMPEIRFMLERQRAYSIGQLNDDPQLSQVRETVGKRATATENERLDNNNASEVKNFNPQEHRSSSQMEKSDSKHFIDKDEMEVVLDKRGDTKPNDGLRRKSTPQLGQCQCCSGNQMPTMTALKKESSLNKSNESSPGSARSAFRIATKSKRETYSGHEQSSNIKDLEEMNTSQHVFKPQLITDRHHSDMDCGSIHRQRIRTSDHSTPPLNFSDSRPVVKDFGTSSGSRNKIHCISRAVQVNEASLLARPIPHSYLLQDSCFYYACDRWTQCSNLDHGWSLQSGFHKSTQTAVPTFEMSCQTSEFHDGSHANRSGDSLEISLRSFRNFETKAVNTVVSLIGREHEYDHSLSPPRLSTSYFPCRFESTLDFRFVDETLEQIERELSHIEKKECVNYLNLVTNVNAEHDKDRKERREILRDLKLTTSDLSSIDKCYKKPKRSKSVTEEITPSSSTDETDHEHIKELQTSFKDGDIHRKGLEDSQHISEKKINKLFPLGLNNTIQTTSSLSNSLPHGVTISQPDVGENKNNKNISDSSTVLTPETKRPPLDTGHFISKCLNVGSDHRDHPIGHSDGGFQNSNIYRTDLQQNKAEIEQFSSGIKRSASVNKCQEKVTQWRRFSLPTIGLHKTTIRTHSKLSRLKYLSSSQNSCNSLDLELDFMNASDTLTKFSSENNDQCISCPKNKHDRSMISINDNKKHFSEPNVQFVAEADFKDYSACHSVKPCNETVITSPYRKKPLSPKVSALRGSQSLSQPADTASGNSTPEICISPLKSFQMDFLQIPGSPKDYLTKAVYPVASSSSGSCSPYNLPGLKGDITDEMRPLENSCVQDSATASNDNQLSMLEGKDDAEGVSLNKKQEYFHSVTYMKASLSDSDLPASTVDSTVDLSLRSSIEQSADEFSDSSMLPRLSVDSTLEELKREKQSEEISIDVDTMDFSDFKKTWNNKGVNSGGAVNSKGVITPDFHTAMLNIQKDSHTSVQSNHIETIVQDSFDMEDVSNRSVAGSDILQLEELDIDLSQINFSKTRSSSASSYSEPMLENLGSLSQDSLSSEEGKFLMNYLRIGDNLDDLLQVSDYGGTSPSPTKMRCLSEVNSTLSGNTEREEAQCESPKRKLATLLHVASSGALAELSNYDNGTEKDTSKRVNKKTGMTSDTFGLKSKKTRVKATKSCETGLESYKNKKNYEKKIDEIVDDSSGDECDKEILRINLNRPVRKRLMKTNSDPVDKDIFCRSKKVPTQNSQLSDDKVEVEKRVDSVENKSTPDQPNSTEMMAIFQNVNLSYLQNRSNVSPLKVNEGDELAEYSLKPFSVLDQTSTACVLSVEFTKEDSLDISDANDDPIENLASELEMMLLLENLDSYAEHLSSLNEGPILSPARHFPLPQISEEGTVSEDASEGGGLNHKMLSFSDKASQDSDLGLAGNAHTEEAIPVVKDGNSVEDNSVQVSEEQPASPKIIRLPTDNNLLFLLESYDADSVFEEAVSVNSPLTLNSVYSRRLDNQDMLNVNIRAVSPSSKVFDFAQSLVGSNIPIISPETSTEQSIDSLELTSSENGDNEAIVTSDSEGLANTLSFDSHIFHFPPNNQVLETHTVEKKIDLLGTVVTKFASTHTVRFNHINAPPSNTDHEKHLSTASLMIGDYRQAKKEKENNDSCIVQCSDNNRSCSGFEKDVKNRKTELQFDNSNVNMNTVSESKKEQLKEKVRAFLLIDQPCKQESPRELEYEKSDKDLQVIEHGSQNDKIAKTCTDYYSDLEDTTLIHVDEAIDIKSRVKAMFMIEDRNAPGNIASEGQRVKVTTMFSQNSKEARSSFSSTSISDLDDTAGTEIEAPKQNCVRTQHKSDAASVAPGAEIRKKPRKLRTRDSLLKLHEQTNISSSMGSDNESDLVSALRNQGDYDVRERDLALGLLTADVIDEEDTTSEVHSCDSYSKNDDNTKSIRVQNGKDCIRNSETVTQNSDSESDVVTKDINAPKVIIQQPSEDNSQESLRRLNLPLLNLAAVSGNSGLESGFGNMSPPTESSDTKYPFSAKHGSSSWLRRSPRMHFLSPNAALTQKKYYDCLQLRDYSASSAADESHPELEYLDILPKFSQYQSNKRADGGSDYLSPQKKSVRDKLPTFLLQEPDDFNESESRCSSYRLSIRSPEPRPGVHFDDLDDLIVVCDSNSTSTPPSNSSDTQNNVVQLETLEESHDEYSGQQWSINVDDFEQTYEPHMQFCKDKDSELHITDDEAEIRSIVGDSENQDQNELFGSNNDFEINKDNLVYDTKGEYLSEEPNRDLFSQLHVQINDIHVNTDRKYNDMYSDIAYGISERSDHSWANRLSQMSEAESQPFFRSSSDSEIGVSQEPQLFVEDANVISDAQAGSECYTESLIPWSNVIDNIATPGDILEDPQSQYKKLLSVTSHDSGFDSQGSPIELTTLRTSDWGSTLFRVVQEETVDPDIDEIEANNLF
ncbi:uncharacterized protein LOC106072065 isoform X1 [Biomphalaria glabrata]|uniref:Uncharacterized protein LOC106072065 isoform X1 n=2 Tax=Biomphalaria glabrata TaxID=6526 RepID=A0A9W2YG42_BIOGL|nr:uncharacterized protein LOC106072065 isoform X1 [Biomphalaria glabrata]